MRLDVSLSQKLSLQLKLAPQIIQSIEILQLPALSLQELVEAALGENEALEREDDQHPEPQPNENTNGEPRTDEFPGSASSTPAVRSARGAGPGQKTPSAGL